MFQINKHTKKENPKGSGKKKTLFIFCNNRQFRSESEDNSKGRHVFTPLLVFYSITISRVLKITVECRFIDDFSQTKINLVLKKIDLCVAKKIKFCHFIYVVFNFFVEIFSPFYIFVSHVSSLPLLLRFL